MKTYALIAALAALILAGCGSGDQASTTPTDTPPVAKAPEGGGTPGAGASAVQTAYDTGSIKKGDKAHCVVCVVKEGSKEEEAVAETLDYQGKTYAFCNESEKAEFISEPAKYAAK